MILSCKKTHTLTNGYIKLSSDMKTYCFIIIILQGRGVVCLDKQNISELTQRVSLTQVILLSENLPRLLLLETEKKFPVTEAVLT